MSLKLCMCQGNREGQHLARFTRAPLMSGGHTNFILIRCAECRRLWGSPRKNFQLAAVAGTDRLWIAVQQVARYAVTHAS